MKVCWYCLYYHTKDKCCKCKDKSEYRLWLLKEEGDMNEKRTGQAI